ncbi:MAG: tetratricopeptide repeat protein [Elusimicrobia bacterium]|nr:tetratricopeptide repeat protein [Elusimicrobiota bacterium]
MARSITMRLPALLWLAVAAALLCRAAEPPVTETVAPERLRDVAVGESLVHGLQGLADTGPGVISWSMPLQGVVSDLALNHAPAALGRWLPQLLWLVCLGLTFALGQGLHSGLCGGLAALAAAPLLSLRFGYEAVYTFLVLLTANLMVRAAAEPALGWDLMLGASLGLGLLERSALFLFGPLLACWETFRRPAVWRRAALALVLVPIVFILPWVGMNWRLHRELVLFERGRAGSNIIAGVLGVERALEGDVLGLAGPQRPRSVLAWAAREAAAHPGRYLRATAARLWGLLLLQPGLFALAGLAVWRRRSPGQQRLALLAAYFPAVHCLMAVKPSYLLPLWPILAALAASLPAELALGAAGPRERAYFSRAAVPAAFWTALALGTFTLLRVCLYPRPGAAIDAAISENPGDAGLWTQRALLSLGEGRPEAALPDLRRALALRPDREAQFHAAWALAARGGAGADLVLRLPPPSGGQDGRGENQLRMLVLLRRGRLEEAAAAAAEAGRLWSLPYLTQAGVSAAGQELQERLARDDRSLRNQVCALIVGWPPRERFALAADWELALRRGPGELRADPLCGRDRTAGWWRDAAASDGPGARAQILRALAREQRLHPEAGTLLESALARQRAGDYGGALRLLERMAEARPREASVLSARGVVHALRGESGEAVRDLRTAINLDRYLLDAYVSLGAVHEAAGDRGAARRVYEDALRLDARLVDPGLRGLILAKRGRRGPSGRAARVLEYPPE